MLLRCKGPNPPMSQLGQNPPHSGSIVSQLSPAADMPLHWLLSEKCQLRSLAGLLDYLVGNGEEPRRECDTERLGGL
jgi:hypothetical protein